MLVFPDPFYRIEAISGAAFLYFPPPILFSMPPVVLTADGFRLLDIAKERNPMWAPAIFNAFNMWRTCRDGYHRVAQTLDPLKPHAQTVWMIYGGDNAALSRVDSLLDRIHISPQESLERAVDPLCAAGELIRHIFLETWLAVGEDLDALYQYCDRALGTEEASTSLLARCYFLRLAGLEDIESDRGALLLTNPRLLRLMQPFAASSGARTFEDGEALDAAIWEVFKQIVGKYTDPLVPAMSEIVRECRDNRAEEVEALKSQCAILAEKLAALESDPHAMAQRVEKLVRMHAEADIAALLRLDERAKRDFIQRLLTDKVSWAALIGTVSAFFVGHGLFEAAAGLSIASSICAHGAGAVLSRRDELRKNPYRLVYSLTR